MGRRKWYEIRRIGMNWKFGIIFVGAGILVGGCFAPDPISLKSEYAVDKIPAIKLAAQKDDRTAIPTLIDSLDDPDTAIRLAAIEALQKMTGQTFGYVYYDDDSQRRPAIMQWKQWLSDHPEAVKPAGK